MAKFPDWNVFDLNADFSELLSVVSLPVYLLKYYCSTIFFRP